MCKRIKTGDTIRYKMWDGSVASAKVLEIEICPQGEKYGRSVKSATLKPGRNIVLDLDNNHWAYASQIINIESTNGK